MTKKEVYKKIRRECRRVDFIRDFKTYISYIYKKINILKGFKLLVWWLMCFAIFILSLPSSIFCYLLSKFTKEELIFYIGSNKYDDTNEFCTCILNWIFNKKE